MKDCKKIEEMKEELKQSPIFAMSLSSKELFHSNFWAWLFERNVEYIKIFFEDFEFDENVQKYNGYVEREQKNRDITVWKSVKLNNKREPVFDKAYIIENKFKSLPDEEQLKRYQSDIEYSKDKNGNIKIENGEPVKNKEFCEGVITGIIKPKFMERQQDSLTNWKFLSYEDIGNAIIETAERIEQEGFEKKIIVEYGNIIKMLYDLLMKALKDNGEKWNADNRECNEIRVGDIYSKLVALQLANYLENNLKNNPKINERVGNFHLHIEQSYGFGKAAVNVVYIKESSDKDNELLTELGVQIQGGDYRWTAQKNIVLKEDSKAIQDFYEKIKKTGWFVDYDYLKSEKRIEDHTAKEKRKTGMGKAYGLFIGRGKNPYTKLYQYWQFEKDKNDSFDDICNIIERDMLLAKEIILKNKF